MITREALLQIPFFQGLPDAALAQLASVAQLQSRVGGDLIIHQHDRAIAVWFLLSGRVQFLMHVEGVSNLLVATSRTPGSLLGWSAFRAPFRYTTSVRCEGACELLRIPHGAFEDIFARDPHCGMEILQRVAATMARRLEQARKCLLELPGSGDADRVPASADTQAVPGTELLRPGRVDSHAAHTDLFAHSSMFEGLEQADLAWLAEQGEVVAFEKGQTLFEQGAQAGAFFLLVTGRVALFYSGQDQSQRVFLRSIAGAGEPLGWAALVEPRHYSVSGEALEQTRVLAFTGEALVNRCRERPEFGLAILRRILGVIGSRLRSTRIRLVARRFDQEISAIRALLEQGAESLHVTSPLYKVPHLLENRLTLADAFHTLELVQAHGDELERNLAGLALEILVDVHKELDFYQGLQHIYETIANAPPGMPPEEVRQRSMEGFVRLFSNTRHVIRGEENLPDAPGFIVIMNHLENHPDNLLPNDFRLTLDTHFVSSMILFRKYGQAPIRVVRKPKPDWYGFQQYFDRLDYIYVYAGDVDQEDRDDHLTRQHLRQEFLDSAAAHLGAGRNVVIAPEGHCYHTEDSPGPFSAGAFRLAAYARPEPLIVPVAVANFDRKITRTTTAAVILPPFRLSEQLPDATDTEQLLAFINRYHERFSAHVQEAVRLTGEQTVSTGTASNSGVTKPRP
jgi:CRP-like cAMP-binding protein/1-acyl-sn-glycerol-3-phosphate acyltransferase